MLQFLDNYPLKNVTTLNLGGPAKKFVQVKTEKDLIEAIKYARDQKVDYLVIGGGSNLLIADEGTDCLVIKNEIKGIEVATGDGERGAPARSRRSETIEDARWGCEPAGPGAISVKSGTPLQELVDFTIQNGLSDLQKLTGIPGTVGGAIYGNAGAYGQTISDHITEVVILGRSGATTPESEKEDSGQARMTFSKDECRFNYRDSIFKRNKYIILEVKFKLGKADPQILQEEVQEVLAKRLVKYPPGIKCPGSFFKNIIANTLPKQVLDKIPTEKIMYGKVPAGALLETVGAKGQRLDGIRIADYHANLFINDGGSAKDFYELAKIYALKVKEKFNITLDPEVQLINLPPLI